MSRRTRRSAQAGFTLTELLMGIVLMGIFSAALYGFFFSGVTAARSHESQARAQAEGRTAVDRLVREVRQAVSPDDGFTAPVISLGASTLEMYVDPSRVVTETVPRPHRVRYMLSGTRLVRQSAAPVGVSAPFIYGAYGPEVVLIENVVNGATPIFSAVTVTGATLALPVSGSATTDVAQLSVRVQVGQMTGSATSRLEITTDATLRNDPS